LSRARLRTDSSKAGSVGDRSCGFGPPLPAFRSGAIPEDNLAPSCPLSADSAVPFPCFIKFSRPRPNAGFATNSSLSAKHTPTQRNSEEKTATAATRTRYLPDAPTATRAFGRSATVGRAPLRARLPTLQNPKTGRVGSRCGSQCQNAPNRCPAKMQPLAGVKPPPLLRVPSRENELSIGVSTGFAG